LKCKIQTGSTSMTKASWVPAFAGMTEIKRDNG
jgi:hypothetical protein